MNRRRYLLGALALTACAPQAADSAPTAAPTAPARTAPPVTPTSVPPTPTPAPTATPAPEPEEWAGATWRGRVDVTPREARQGTTLSVVVWSTEAQSVSVTYEGRDQPLVRDGNYFVGFFGVERLLARPGPRSLRFTLADASGRRATRSDAADGFRVVDPEYPTEDLVVDEKTLALLDQAKINAEEAVVNRVFSQWTPERRWRGPFAEPMISAAGPVPLTSDFGTRRNINGRPSTWPHEGIDYEVDTGDPIRACADGVVVLAEALHTRGNSVFIDHGWGVMSGYSHMFQWQVQVGQEVTKGQQIGLVGSTGFVTGPHLHWEVRVRNVPVEPLEWCQREPFSRPDLASL